MNRDGHPDAAGQTFPSAVENSADKAPPVPSLAQSSGVTTRRYPLWTLLVIVAAAATYLAGGGRVHLWDRDEAWYAQASKQMVESGNWVVTYFLDQPRYSKPIFVYWCQALCMKLLGPTERAARLPSAIAMTITLSILAWSIGRALGARRAFHTVLIFASSLMVIASAKMCLTDSVLLTFLTTAQLCLFAIYWRGNQSRASVRAGPNGQNTRGVSGPARTLAPHAATTE
ncbi:MAG: ArnT family glycosyltransferase, partial [Tepidisphaerales bacterium]